MVLQEPETRETETQTLLEKNELPLEVREQRELLLVKLVKRPDLKLTCNRSSLDAIKRIEISNSKHISAVQIITDWLDTLSDKERETYLAFCKKTSSPIQMYLYARFLGYKGSITECDTWSKKNLKKETLAQYLR